MRKKLKFTIFFILLACIILGQIFLSNIFKDILPRVEVSSLKYDIPSDKAFQYSDLMKLAGYNFSFQKETTGYVMNQPVNIIITNGNYDVFKDFKLNRGSFFTDDASRFGLNVAVISDELSFQLFRTIRSVGNRIEINGITYTIVGVYKQNSLYTWLTSNGRENIYIPAKSDFDRQFAVDIGIQRLLIKLDENEIDEFIEEKVRADSRYITFAIDEYIVKDYSRANLIIHQFVKITGFIAAIMFIILMCKYIFYELKNQLLYIKEKLENLSLKDILSENLNRFTISLISILVAIISIVVPYKLSAFRFYVPSKYISPISIFDFAYYKELIQNKLIHNNLYYSFNMSPYAIFYRFELIINAIFMILQVVLIINLYVYINSFLKEHQKGGV